MEILETLDPLHKSLWYIAIPTSVIFLIQTILTFFGADASDGIDADFDSNLDGTDAPFQLFSFRNLINFLLGFSWTGISFYKFLTPLVLVLLSLLVGILFVWIFFLVIQQLQKLSEDNSFKISNTLNKTADVYLAIPEKKSGKGKIMISVKGSFHEIDAITENQKIETGSVVKVVKIESDHLVIVELV